MPSNIKARHLLRIFSTLARDKVEFVPLVEGQVGIYVCGPTVYGPIHIGNARTFTAFDVVVRFLRHLGFAVRYVRNVTDVDDKIVRTAWAVGSWRDGADILTLDIDGTATFGTTPGTWRMEGATLRLALPGSERSYAVDAGHLRTDAGVILERTTPPLPAPELARHFEDVFVRDAARLKLVVPDVAPKVSDTIAEIVDLIGTIVAKGKAYVIDGDVYFDVARQRDYLRLSHRTASELQAGARVDVDARKRNAEDFALWKAAKPGELSWPSPWGEGRPGWHIECSAMSLKYLGERFDIHGGGLDLIFPHHENELAQTTAATDQEMCSVWMHAGFLDLAGAKMSKSLGNVVDLARALEAVDADALRLFFLSTHYRAPLSFSDKSLDDAEARIHYFYETLAKVDERLQGRPVAFAATERPNLDAFETAMCDDFNVPAALAVVGAAFSELNATTDLDALARVREEVRAMGAVLGAFDLPPSAWLMAFRSRKARARGIDEAEVAALVARRDQARASKDFRRADEIRAALLALGVEVLDSPRGTEWRITG